MENLTLNVNGYETRTFKAGKTLLHEGRQPSSVYILKEGSVLIISERTVLTTLDTPGTILGEIAYLFNYKHTASVVAAVDSIVYVVDDFFEFLKKAPDNLQEICKLMQVRLRNTGLKGLENRPLDLKLSSYNIEKISKNEVVIQEGQPGRKVYLLREGTVKAISVDSVIYRGNTPGMMFGEITSLINGLYTISVICVTDCSFYVINDMQEFFKLNPEESFRITQFLAKRLENTIDRFAEFKADVMRNPSQIGERNFLNKLVEINDQISAVTLNPFSKTK